jgi:hypothetical protein
MEVRAQKRDHRVPSHFTHAKRVRNPRQQSHNKAPHANRISQHGARPHSDPPLVYSAQFHHPLSRFAFSSMSAHVESRDTARQPHQSLPASLLSCNSLYHHVGSVGFFPRVLPSPSESSFDRALRSLPQQRKWDEKQRCTSPQSSILHTVCVPSPIRTSSHPLPEWVSPDTESWERSSGHLA